MQNSKLNDWVQIFATIGVLIGLLLVYLEIRQNNELTNAEARVQRLVSWEEFTRFEVETNIRELVVKSVESPEELTDAEILMLDSWLWNIVSIYQQGIAMQQFGLADDQTPDLEDAARFYFNNRFGRAWFEVNRRSISIPTPEFVEVVSRTLDGLQVQEEFWYLDQIKLHMKQ